MNNALGVWARYITTALLFLVPIVPLIVANTFFFPFITGKAFYFRILIELAFFSWIILALIDARYRPKITPITIGITIFAIITLIADLLGVNPWRSIWSNFERMEGWITILHLWAFFLVTTSLFGYAPIDGEESRRWWHRWFNISLGVATIVAIYGLFQLFGWAAIHQGSTRIDASLGNAAYMAVYMLIHTFLAAYFFFHTLAKRSGSGLLWVYGILSVLFGFMVFETATRGSILGLIGGILLALAFYAIFAGKKEKKSRWIAVGVIGGMILIGVVFWINRSAEFIQRSEVLSRMASISWNETKTQARGYIWPMAIKGFTERPILGWGQENFNYIFNANYNPHMWNQEQWFDRAHNVFLDWLVAGGIVGLLSYLALYILLLVALWNSTLSITEKSVMFGLVAAYAVHNIFVFDNLASYILFASILGYGSSLGIVKKLRRLPGGSFSEDVIRYAMTPAVLVLLVCAIYFLNVRPLQANTRLIAALQACASQQPNVGLFESTLDLDAYVANQEIREQLLACSGNVLNGNYPNDQKQQFFTLAEREINKQVADTPDDARIHTLAGYFWALTGNLGESQSRLEKALELSPRKQSTALQLATVYLNNNKVDEALALYKETYESDTNYPAAKEAYIRALIVVEKEPEARRLFAATDPELFESETVAQIYLSLQKNQQAFALYEKLIAANPADIDLRVRFVQALHAAGMKTRAVQVLQQIAKDRPDLKPQVEATIKQIQ